MAIDMFLKLGDIVGESQDAVHRDEIDVLAWSWGASQAGSLHVATGGAAGKANFQDLSITKLVDRSSDDLLRILATGDNIAEGQLTLRSSGSVKPLEFLVIKFSPVLVTSLTPGGSAGEDRLTENLTLNFGQFEYQYTPRRPDGGVDPVEVMKWSIAENTPL